VIELLVPKDSDHSASIRSVAFAHKSDRLVIASEDATARLIDVATHKEVTLKNDNPVWFATFSPDDKFVVTTSGDHLTRIWNAADGTPWMTLRGHEALVSWADFSPDGKHLLTASWDGTSLIWELGKHEPVLKLEGPRFTSAVFSPNGERVATASDDGLVRVWDAHTGTQLATFAGHTDALYSVAYSHNGRYLLTASKDRTARVWDAATGREIIVLRGHDDDVRFAAFSPDDKIVVTTSADGTARLWRMPAHCEQLLKEAHAAKPGGMTADEKHTYFQDKPHNSWTVMLAGQGERCNP
jgi:WD40 repeat protein